MAKKYPDITDYKNLNKYADLFKTSESGGKGQFLDGDPSYVTNDEALVKNLKLNYKVVYAGSEAALITGVPPGGEEQEAADRLLLRSAVVPVRGPAGPRQPPEVHGGCDADAGQGRVRLPETPLKKIVAKKFADSGSPAAAAIKASSGRTTTRTSWRSTSRRTRCPPTTPRRSGSRTTRTRSTPGSSSPSAPPGANVRTPRRLRPSGRTAFRSRSKRLHALTLA